MIEIGRVRGIFRLSLALFLRAFTILCRVRELNIGKAVL